MQLRFLDEGRSRRVVTVIGKPFCRYFQVWVALVSQQDLKWQTRQKWGKGPTVILNTYTQLQTLR